MGPLLHELLRDARFYVVLLQIDRDLAARERVGGCEHCGGRLYVANYGRKPRGAGVVLPAEYERRLSLCCGMEGCRKRRTPPSVRFLGRRVYLGAVVVLVTALCDGLTKKRAARLQELLGPGASIRTMDRWRRWWRETFSTSPFWTSLRGRLARPVDITSLPSSLLACFAGGVEPALVGLLRLLAPITTSPGLRSTARSPCGEAPRCRFLRSGWKPRLRSGSPDRSATWAPDEH